jgi:hypothetical protein
MMLYYATVKTQKDGAADTVAAISATKTAVDDGSICGKMEAMKVKAFELWKQDNNSEIDAQSDCWNFYIIHESRQSFEATWAGRDKHPLFQALAKDTADTPEHPSTAEHQCMVMEAVFQVKNADDNAADRNSAGRAFFEIHVKEEKGADFSEKMQAFVAANKDGVAQFDLGKDGDRRGYSKEKLDQGAKKVTEDSKIWGVYVRATTEKITVLKDMLQAEKTDLGITYYDGQE